jgi:hypothetical protein
MKISHFDVDKLKALHAEGHSDRMIAERIGCKLAVIHYQRHKLALIANKKVKESRAPKGSRPSSKRRNARARADAPGVTVPPAISAGGAAIMVPIRVDVLDAIWAELDPQDKAGLLNHLVESRAK